MKNPSSRFHKYIFSVFCFAILMITNAIHSEQVQIILPYKSVPKAKALVVVYSLTDNTKMVADLIAKRFRADMIILKAKKYDGEEGKKIASKDAWNEVTLSKISPEKINMSKYNLIFLGSPIWWYRPAVPLWTFVQKNNFQNKKIVLFNTFNSRFKSVYIEKIKKSINNNNGIFHNHIFVRRGRWYEQLSQKDLLKKFNAILKKNKKQYIQIIQDG